jgi:hypothetical protein
VELSPNDKSRTRFHLGMNSGGGVPAGDLSRLEEAMARIPDSYWYSRVVEHLDRCDRAWAVSEVFGSPDGPRPSRIERFTGDTERAIYQSDPIKADQIGREVYLREVDRLAETLYVSNYRREESRRHGFWASGGEFVNALPGPADTSVVDRIAHHTGTSNWR